MSLLITDAGISAATAAGDLGVSYKIAYISVGTEGYIPAAGQTELKNEVARVEITKGFDNGNGQLHGEAVFDGDNEFVGKELGYHLTDGTLFAVDSRGGEIISVKRSNTIVTEAFDLNLANSSIDNITVAITGVTAATDEDIDNKAQTKRMVLLPQFWRALNPILAKANEALNIANSKITKAQADLWYWERGETVTNSTKLNNKTNSTAPTYSTIAERDSSGDLFARIFRSNHQDESAISGGLAFRKSTSDNYIRFCNNVAAIRAWLKVFSQSESDERYQKKGEEPETGGESDGAIRIDNIDGMQYNPYSSSIAQLKDGRIIVWGQQINDTTSAALGCGYTTHGGKNITGYKVIPLPQKKWKKYGIYGNAGFALSDDGELYTWGGHNTAASTIGQNSPYWSNLPKFVISGVEDIILSKFSSHHVDYSHSVLIMSNGSFKYYGANNNGQAQNNLTSPVYTPINWTPPNGESKTSLKELVSFGNHYNWFLWVGNNGRHYVIGNNSHGQFGDGTRISCSTWKELAWLRGKRIDQVVGGSLCDRGSHDIWMAVRSGTEIWYTGLNSFGQNGSLASVNTPTKMLEPADKIYAFGGGAPTLFRQYGNDMFARGHSSEGQAGTLLERTNDWNNINPIGINQFTPKFYTTTHSHQMPYFSNAFAVITDNGIERLFAIGANRYGSCGLGYQNNRPEAGGMLEVSHPFRSSIKDIITNGFDDGVYSLVLLENGELWGCGYGGRNNISGVFSGSLSSESSYVFKRLF